MKWNFFFFLGGGGKCKPNTGNKIEWRIGWVVIWILNMVSIEWSIHKTNIFSVQNTGYLKEIACKKDPVTVTSHYHVFGSQVDSLIWFTELIHQVEFLALKAENQSVGANSKNEFSIKKRCPIYILAFPPQFVWVELNQFRAWKGSKTCSW